MRKLLCFSAVAASFFIFFVAVSSWFFVRDLGGVVTIRYVHLLTKLYKIPLILNLIWIFESNFSVLFQFFLDFMWKKVNSRTNWNVFQTSRLGTILRSRRDSCWIHSEMPKVSEFWLLETLEVSIEVLKSLVPKKNPETGLAKYVPKSFSRHSNSGNDMGTTRSEKDDGFDGIGKRRSDGAEHGRQHLFHRTDGRVWPAIWGGNLRKMGKLTIFESKLCTVIIKSCVQ